MPNNLAEVMVGEYARNQIVSSDNENAAKTTFRAALYFMAAGYMAEGKLLLLKLQSSPLWIDGLDPHQALDNLLHSDSNSLNLSEAMSFSTEKSPYFKRHVREDLNALAGWEDIINTYTHREDINGYQLGTAYIRATELAAKHGQIEKAIALIQKWARNYAQQANWTFDLMLSNEHVAPLLKQGILAEVLGMPDIQIAMEYLRGLEIAFNMRLEQGQTLAYGSLTMRTLLERISSLALTNEPEHFAAEQKTANWIGYSPATEETIHQAEIRLGLELPADYRAFLLVSNGFPYLGLRPELMSVEQIGFLRDIETKQTMDIYSNYPDDIFDYLRRSIKVGCEIDSTERLLLIPPLTPYEHWGCWFFAHWIPDEVRYMSFRAYLEHLIDEIRTDF